MKFSTIDEAELGDTVYYVSDKHQERIEGKQAELLAIDRQAGESPFYTIKIHDSSIEKQTEAVKLFKVTGVKEGSEGMPLDLCDEIEYPELKDTCTNAEFTYLTSSLYALLQPPLNNDNGNDDGVDNNNDLQLGLYLVQSILPSLNTQLGPTLRGLCVKMIENSDLKYGLLLLNSLSMSAWGKGHGIWMMPSLQRLLTLDHSSFTPEMCNALNEINSNIECSMVIVLLERVTITMCKMDIKYVNVKVALMKCYQQLHKVKSQIAADVSYKVCKVALEVLCDEDDDEHPKGVASLLIHTLITSIDRTSANTNTNSINRSSMRDTLQSMEQQLVLCMMKTTMRAEFRIAAAKSLELLYDLEDCITPMVKEAMEMIDVFGESEEDERDIMEMEIGKQVAIRTLTGPLFSVLSKELLSKYDKNTSSSSDKLVIILTLYLAMKKLDAISLYTQLMHTCLERSTLNTVRSLTASYFKSSGMLDVAVKLLFEMGALLYAQSSLLSSSSPKKNANKFNVKDINEALCLVGKDEWKLQQLAEIPFLTSDAKCVPSVKGLYDEAHLQSLAGGCLRRIITIVPSYLRSWWLEDAPEVKGVVRDRFQPFIEKAVSSHLILRELSLIQAATSSGKVNEGDDDGDDATLSITGSIHSGEIKALYVRDEGESKVEIVLKLPPSYPLTLPVVEFTRKIGIEEGRWRRWQLQIMQSLSRQDGSVVDAILIWKNNVQKEFKGLEPCPVCYCILHPKTAALPKLECPTCHNKFHNVCLMHWFKTSGKNKCVLCQQPFFL